MKYEIFDHTGDIGIRFYGKTLEDLIIDGFRAVSSLMGSQPGRKHEIIAREDVKSSNPEAFFYDLILRLIYHFEVNSVHMTSIEFPKGIGKKSTEVVMHGYRINGRFAYKHVFKSPTFHMLEISPEKGYGTIVIDI